MREKRGERWESVERNNFMFTATLTHYDAPSVCYYLYKTS